MTSASPVEDRARLDDPDELLDARADPAAFEFGTSGSEAASDLNWLALLTRRVQRRVEAGAHHRWWVLSGLLSGLFALNFTFTVFIVALPRVAHELGTSITVLTWTMIGPLLAYGLAAPLFGKAGDVFGHRRLYMLGLSLGHEIGFSSVGATICWVATGTGVAVFVHRVRTAANPLIPPAYFARRNFTLPMVVRCAGNFAYFGAFFLAPLVMELGYGFSITKVGLVSIARPLAFAICSPIAGYAAVRIGERTTAVVGAASLCGSLVLFAALAPSTSLAVLVVALALSGLGMGVAMPATSSMMANTVRERDFGVMSAAQILAMQVGQVAGIQVLATIQQGIMRNRGLTPSSEPAALLATFRVPFIVGAAAAGVALAAALLLREPRRAIAVAPATP